MCWVTWLSEIRRAVDLTKAHPQIQKQAYESLESLEQYLRDIGKLKDDIREFLHVDERKEHWPDDSA